MKIKLFLVIMICIVDMSIAQIPSRVIIDGKISGQLDDNLEGVVVYNRTTNKSTITNQNGDFQINVGVSDKLEVVSIQYQKFTVIIDDGVIENKRLTIFLTESVNQLDEVVVTPYDLLGNVKADLKKIKISDYVGVSQVAKEASSGINDYDYDFKPDKLSPLRNNAVLDNNLINGVNFVNLVKLLIKKNKTSKKKGDRKIDDYVRNMYNDQFFKDNLALDINQINDFIFFAEENGLDNTYLEKGKELDLIKFLIEKSKLYKNQK